LSVFHIQAMYMYMQCRYGEALLLLHIGTLADITAPN